MRVAGRVALRTDVFGAPVQLLHAVEAARAHHRGLEAFTLDEPTDAAERAAEERVVERFARTGRRGGVVTRGSG